MSEARESFISGFRCAFRGQLGAQKVRSGAETPRTAKREKGWKELGMHKGQWPESLCIFFSLKWQGG